MSSGPVETPTLWSVVVGEPIIDAWCLECEAHCALIANYAMGLGMDLAGVETVFSCTGCGRRFVIPGEPCLIERPIEPAYE